MATRFTWDGTLDRDVRERLREKITATLDRWGNLPESPARVIVSRPALNFLDDRVTLQIIGESGNLLAAGRMKPP